MILIFKTRNTNNTHFICCVQNEVDSSNCGGAVAGCCGDG